MVRLAQSGGIGDRDAPANLDAIGQLTVRRSARGMASIIALPIFGHPDTLMFPTVLADIARHVRGIYAVLEVISSGLSITAASSATDPFRRS